MPYSITTQDGITINNIPDNIDPNSDVLRQRVVAIRGGQDGLVDTGGAGGDVSQPILGDTPTQAQILANAQRLQELASPGVGQQVGAGEEALFSIASGALAEPIAGVAGIAQALNPFAAPGAGARAVEATREALTLQPPTQAGQEALVGAGEALGTAGRAIVTPVAGIAGIAQAINPLAEPGAGARAVEATQEALTFGNIENFLGNKTLELTGSPALAAAAKTLPTAVLEALGGAAALAKRGGRLKRTGKEALKVTEKRLDKALVEAAPQIETLKDASRAVYKEIGDIGVQVKPEAANSLLKTVVRKARKANVDSVLTPKSARVVEQFVDEIRDRSLRTIEDLDNFRSKAQIAASSADLSDARVGAIMIDEIDSFMDKIGPAAFVGEGAKEAAGIGGKYKVARKLWGRARRAEVIQEAMDKASRQASGFENGIRNQLRAILNNKKRSRFFSKEELSSMDAVVQGSNEQNILKLVGRLGFSEGQATNIIGGLAGTAVFGPVTPIIGQASRALAQRSTRKAAALSDAVVKAGPNGRAIVEAYRKTIPFNQRSAAELSNLLVNANPADIDDLLKSANRATRAAAELAKGRKAFAAGAITAGVAPSLTREQQ